MRSLAMILFSLVVALTLMTACTTTPASTPTPTPGPITITDDLNRTVTVAEIPQRIVSLSPSNTEILFALDLGDKVVGVTDFCDYPEELLAKIDAGEIQRVGTTFPGFNLETIVDLEPDVAFAIGATVPEYVTDLEGLGIPVIILQPEDIDGIFSDIELVGEVTGKEAEAETLIADLAELIDEIVAKVADAPLPRVFYGTDVSNPNTLYTVGSGTFIDALITLAGGENITGVLEGWTTYNLEDLVYSNPNIVVIGGANWGVSAEEVASRLVWQDLDAVKNGKIFAIDDTPLVRPGPRIADGLELLAGLIHPELFKD
jgi:iron complex transport system substrate-binding protein